MGKYHGIIFAYHDEPALRELVAVRTAASLPFCGRYRLIDFALSSAFASLANLSGKI